MLGAWFLFQLLRCGQLATGERRGGVAYFAHIGGFLFGLLADQAVRERVHEDYDYAAPDPGLLMARAASSLAVSLALIVLLAFLTVARDRSTTASTCSS